VNLWLLVGSTNQPTVVIYFKKFNYGHLGLPWQPEAIIFSLIIFCNCLLCLSISYLFFNISIMDLRNCWGQLCRTFAASVGAGIEQLYLRVPKFHWGGARVKKGQKIPLT